jgi:hypothetical protein
MWRADRAGDAMIRTGTRVRTASGRTGTVTNVCPGLADDATLCVAFEGRERAWLTESECALDDDDDERAADEKAYRAKAVRYAVCQMFEIAMGLREAVKS